MAADRQKTRRLASSLAAHPASPLLSRSAVSSPYRSLDNNSQSCLPIPFFLTVTASSGISSASPKLSKPVFLVCQLSSSGRLNPVGSLLGLGALLPHFALPLRLQPRSLLCTLFGRCDTRDDIIEWVLDNPDAADLWWSTRSAATQASNGSQQLGMMRQDIPLWLLIRVNIELAYTEYI